MSDKPESIIPDEFRENLNAQQQKAIVLLLSGYKKSDVADEVGVSRQTLWNWRKKDEDYKEAYKSLQEEQIQPHIERLVSNTDLVVDTLIQAIQQQDVDTSLKLLDRLVQRGGLRDQVISDGDANLVAQGPREKNLLRVFRRNKTNERMLDYVALLIEEREPDEIIDLLQDELHVVEGKHEEDE